MTQYDTDMADISLLVPVTVDPYMLIDHMIRSMTYEELIDFIVLLDESIEDWDFTIMLHEYACEQYDKYMEGQIND